MQLVDTAEAERSPLCDSGQRPIGDSRLVNRDAGSNPALPYL